MSGIHEPDVSDSHQHDRPYASRVVDVHFEGHDVVAVVVASWICLPSRHDVAVVIIVAYSRMRGHRRT